MVKMHPRVKSDKWKMFFAWKVVLVPLFWIILMSNRFNNFFWKILSLLLKTEVLILLPFHFSIRGFLFSLSSSNQLVPDATSRPDQTRSDQKTTEFAENVKM